MSNTTGSNKAGNCWMPHGPVTGISGNQVCKSRMMKPQFVLPDYNCIKLSQVGSIKPTQQTDKGEPQIGLELFNTFLVQKHDPGLPLFWPGSIMAADCLQ